MPTSRTKKAAGNRSEKPLSDIVLEQAKKYKSVKAMVDEFADTHPKFDYLVPAIEQFIRGGYALPHAYDVAYALFGEKKRLNLKEAVRRAIDATEFYPSGRRKPYRYTTQAKARASMRTNSP
jgi:hypothetical protein